jgi:hypothetical protein
MANHAKVFTGKTLDPNEVNEIVERLNKEKFGGLFSFERGESWAGDRYYWLMHYNNNDDLSLEFWITDEIARDKNEEGGDEIVCPESVIEFRHGHSVRFMWWVEGVLREFLGEHYKAKMWDDGTGWDEEGPQSQHYDTFEKYIRHITDEDLDETIREVKESRIGIYRGHFPEEIFEKLQLDFKI